MTKLGVEKPTCKLAAKAIGPRGQWGLQDGSASINAASFRIDPRDADIVGLGHGGNALGFTDTSGMCDYSVQNSQATFSPKG